MLSLGTGELTRRLPYNEVKGWGLANWAQPILDVVFHGVSDTIHYQLANILPQESYYRFQVTLTQGNDDMDDSSRTNLLALRDLAENLIRDQHDDINRVCEILTS